MSKYNCTSITLIQHVTGEWFLLNFMVANNYFLWGLSTITSLQVTYNCSVLPKAFSVLIKQYFDIDSSSLSLYFKNFSGILHTYIFQQVVHCICYSLMIHWPMLWHCSRKWHNCENFHYSKLDLLAIHRKIFVSLIWEFHAHVHQN